MPIAEYDVVIETPDWEADHPAVHHERLGHAPPTLAMLRHPTFAFMASVRDDGNDLGPLLFEVARRYLERIPELAGLPIADAGRDGELDFGWLALTWGDPQQAEPPDPRRSFWLQRSRCGQLADRTAVLIAGHRLHVNGSPVGLGGSVGLRLVLQVALPADGRSRVRVTGLSAAGLAQVRPAAAAGRRLLGHSLEFDLQTFLRRALKAADETFGFDARPALDGLVPGTGEGDPLRLSGTGRRGAAGDGRIYAWAATLSVVPTPRARRERLIEQVAHMAEPKTVLHADPASRGPGPSIVRRRPTRRAAMLDSFRRETALLPPAAAGTIALGDEWHEVVPTRVGNELLPVQARPHEVPDSDPALRSDQMAAVHAFVRGSELFQRFAAYGLAAADYFKAARLPLLLQHRASFPYASDGETVNARVRPAEQGQSLFEAFSAEQLPQLQVSFGGVNLTHRETHANNADLPRAQPQGLAADRRWAWHEFGHVLNFASTGELEFRFAHSAGDALAAIVADPDSRLATSRRLRHLTFPWAMLTRSHERPAQLGWCWCGRRSKLRLAGQDGPPPIRGGYFEEQLMSSSLFRLYRAIGGQHACGRARRRGASDYVVYLVMRAIALLGLATLVPARSADQFVSALIDADVGTGDWRVAAPWPEGPPARALHRVGGAVHKVVRWAFEQQGLYATADPALTREGAGLPPAVDIFVPGRGQRVDGGYAPVALRWSHATAQPWHADPDSISPNGGATLRLRVGNRGSATAQGVGARAWVSPADGTALQWQELALAPPGLPQNIGPGGWRTFTFDARDADGAPLSGLYLVLAEASCDADRANTDPAAALPCGAATWWTDTTLLTDLVANDNNLGLRIVDFR